MEPLARATLKPRLEYYFEGVGQVSVGVFRRDFRDFFGTSVARVTPAMLETYGLDPAIYGDYFRKNTAFFMSLRNLSGVTDDTEIYGPATPAIAKLRARTEYGSLWQFGLKTSF